MALLACSVITNGISAVLATSEDVGNAVTAKLHAYLIERFLIIWKLENSNQVEMIC